MLADPTNMPFPRPESSTPSRDSSRGGGAPDGQLHLEAMLMAEFNYISVTAYQAMEDRARMFNLYLLLIGVLASGLGVVNQLGGGSRAYTPWLSFGLLFLAAVLGVVFFFKLIRLRQAHRDSLIAMNLIKALYIRLFSNQYQHLQNVFHWRLDTIPGGERVGSVTFLVCFTVAFLDSLCFGAAAFFGYTLFLAPGGLATLKPETIGMPLLVAAGTAAVVAIVQVVYYLSAFSKRREKKRLLKVEERIAQVRLVTEA